MIEHDKHLIDKVCDCRFCQMLDCMFGDPELNDWEKGFVEDVCRYGSRSNYTPKQKKVIERIFNKQRRKYKVEGETDNG